MLPRISLFWILWVETPNPLIPWSFLGPAPILNPTIALISLGYKMCLPLQKFQGFLKPCVRKKATKTKYRFHKGQVMVQW